MVYDFDLLLGQPGLDTKRSDNPHRAGSEDHSQWARDWILLQYGNMSRDWVRGRLDNLARGRSVHSAQDQVAAQATETVEDLLREVAQATAMCGPDRLAPIQHPY